MKKSLLGFAAMAAMLSPENLPMLSDDTIRPYSAGIKTFARPSLTNKQKKARAKEKRAKIARNQLGMKRLLLYLFPNRNNKEFDRNKIDWNTNTSYSIDEMVRG